jgi:predicted MFS family arabinose efflux permease
VLRRLGFRRVLVGNAVASALSIVACGLLTQSVTPVVMLGVIFLSGFLKSLQYNALSTLAYAEVATPQMSAATSLASMAQQVANGAGVAIGAVLIEASLLARGAPSSAATAADIRYAFFVVAGIAVCSLILFRRLAPDAGAELSGQLVTLSPNPTGLDD